ncbi:hypothetical protein ANN_12731 [Periplaneta americana]|uniref:Uncharacterized protein n=1 Tax=Periplaneta americana TaxID=6978 RepID=A0ABQ8TJM4_PERAM|nr:hypothetical protein ANN_12731 [Periplaneta americana]
MTGLCEGGDEPPGSLKLSEISPGSSTESYPAFAHIGLRGKPRKNLNQVTCSDQESNPGHLVSRPDALTDNYRRKSLEEYERVGDVSGSTICHTHLHYYVVWTLVTVAKSSEGAQGACDAMCRTPVKRHVESAELHIVDGHDHISYNAIDCERIPNLSAEQSDGITVFRISTMTSLMLHRCRTGAISLQRSDINYYWATDVRDYLDGTYGNNWCGRGRPIMWPPNTPDLKSHDFFLWGFMKNDVYTRRPRDIHDLRTKIFSAYEKVTPEMLDHTWEELVSRYELCRFRKSYDGWINFENETQDRQEWRNAISEREGKDSGFSYDLLDGARTTFRGMVLRDQPGEYCRRNGRTYYEHAPSITLLEGSPHFPPGPHLWSNGQRVWPRNEVARVRIPVGTNRSTKLLALSTVLRGLYSCDEGQLLQRNPRQTFSGEDFRLGPLEGLPKQKCWL